jgi:hypothetical protein
MKKIIRLILATVFVLSVSLFTACNQTPAPPTAPTGYEVVKTVNEQSVEQVYTSVMDDLSSVRNATVSMDAMVDMEVSQGPQRVGTQVTMDLTAKITQNEYYTYSFVDMGSMFGGSSSSEVTYIDNMVYIKQSSGSYTEKYKVQMSKDDFFEMNGDGNNDQMNVYDFSNYSFDNLYFFVDGDATDGYDYDTYFEMKITGAEAKEFSKGLTESLSGLLQDPSFTASDISYKFVLNSEMKLDHIWMEFDVSVTGKASGQTMTMDMSFSGCLSFTNLGTTTVTAPLDASSYPLLQA